MKRVDDKPYNAIVVYSGVDTLLREIKERAAQLCPLMLNSEYSSTQPCNLPFLSDVYRCLNVRRLKRFPLPKTNCHLL